MKDTSLTFKCEQCPYPAKILYVNPSNMHLGDAVEIDMVFLDYTSTPIHTIDAVQLDGSDPESYQTFIYLFDRNDPVGEHRCLYWYIKPSQLNWFERLFKNPWRQLYHECFGKWNRYFSSTRFYEEVKPCKTASDIISYIMKQGELIDKHNTRPSHGWPINLNE